MKQPYILALFAVLLCGGCTSHLFFVEESHMAFKAKFRAQSAAPFELDLGYRRGMIALIPLQSEEKKDEKVMPDKTEKKKVINASSGNSKQKQITIQHDPDELMSLYSTFKANIGFNDPVEVCHFVATGVAATALLSDVEALESLAEVVGMCDKSEGGEQ